MAPVKKFADAQQQLLEEASSATGLDDFGEDGYREALEILLAAYDESAEFSDIGRYATYTNLVNCLKGRLHTQRGLKTQPAHLDNSISKPIFIVGLPRTGTTVLHRLLAADPANQALEYWLGSYPRPRPPACEWQQLQSYREVDNALKKLGKINPQLKAIHEMSATGVDECRLLLMHSFANVSFQANATIPAYEHWLYSANLSGSYQYYRDALQLIGSNAPDKRWVLKDPSHMWAMDSLLETFPDACIVQTHRDPVKVIASVSGLVLSFRRMMEPGVAAHSVGLQQLQQWARVLQMTMDVRSRYPERFIDIFFDDFIADPIAAVAQIYHHSGGQLDDRVAAQLRQWVQQNPQNKHGEHAYEAEDFGLSPSQIHGAFEAYKNNFRV